MARIPDYVKVVTTPSGSTPTRLGGATAEAAHEEEKEGVRIAANVSAMPRLPLTLR